MQAMIEVMAEVSRRAGAAILEVYEDDDFGVETKADDSPLTRADLAAHNIIQAALIEHYPEIPVFSEESKVPPFSERTTWKQYFLVDPLDGTKEFISRNGEFTVNIALIQNGVSVLGVVYVPVINRLYCGVNPEVEANKRATIQDGGQIKQIRVRKMPAAEEGTSVVIVASRRHGSDEMEVCMQRLQTHFNHVDTRNMGSSLKLCLVAEGKADLYPRLAPTCEWDTAAAQAVVEAAGGRVVDAEFRDLKYNSKEELLNPFFYVLGDAEYDWEGVLLP